MNETPSATIGGQTTFPNSTARYRALVGSVFGACALAIVPVQAFAAAGIRYAPSFAEQSLLASLAAESEPQPVSPINSASLGTATASAEPVEATTTIDELPAADLPAGYHVDRFRADIERLRREHWAATVPVVAPPVVDSTPEFLEEQSQSAWQLPRSTSPATTFLFPWLTLRGLEVAQIASSSTEAGSGLDLFRVPVGKVVAPQLPPLEAPDTYLPQSPDRFDGYIWPARGTITSGYGYRWGRLHRGIDIAGPVGTPILAASSGEVIGSGWSGGYGKLVKLKHQDGSVTYYAHNSRILVSKGQRVRQGQQIAALGNTGRSTGPHLHFEIHAAGKGAVNPIALLPKKR